jgi:hypothetical protein
VSRVYSTRFLGSYLPTSPVEYTVPDDFVAVLRCADVWYDGAVGGGTAAIVVSSIGYLMECLPTGGTPETFTWRGRQVLNAGETVYFSDNVEHFSVLLSGYLLSLP